MTSFRAVQLFTDAYLKQCSAMTVEQRLAFLFRFGQMVSGRCVSQQRRVPKKAISMRVDRDLLEVFKERCAQEGVPYQRRIQELMQQWVGSGT